MQPTWNINGTGMRDTQFVPFVEDNKDFDDDDDDEVFKVHHDNNNHHNNKHHHHNHHNKNNKMNTIRED